MAGHYKSEVGRELHRLGAPYNIAFNHDQLRSYNGRWGVMEQQPGQVNWGPYNLRPYPGAVRLWLWTAVGHGAELLETYRYRQPRCGAEQYHEGVVGLDGVALSIHPQSEQFDPVACVQNFYSGFKKFGLTVDMITPHQNKDLSSYSLICIALVDLASDDRGL